MLTVIDSAFPSDHWWSIATRGTRNSWESWGKSDSGYVDGVYVIGPADAELVQRLARLGDDHGKVLRQAHIVADVKAPGYFWREFDTYRAGVGEEGYDRSDVTWNSTSQMHTAGRAPFTADMFADVSYAVLQELNHLRAAWLAEGKDKPGPAWRKLIANMPYGYLYTRTLSLSYQAARSMYHARKYHRLDEWRQLCAWLETVPEARLITAETEVERLRRRIRELERGDK